MASAIIKYRVKRRKMKNTNFCKQSYKLRYLLVFKHNDALIRPQPTQAHQDKNAWFSTNNTEFFYQQKINFF